MLLKRIFKEDGSPNYLSLAHTGTSPEQNFSVKLVTEFSTLGYMEIDGKQLVLHTCPEDLRYTIRREPGRYCLHCGDKLPDDVGGQLARLHVATKHPGMETPGYEALNHYECVLDTEQHERFKAPEPEHAPVFHMREV